MPKKKLKQIVSFIILIFFILTVGFTFYLQGTRIDYGYEIQKIGERQADKIAFGIAQCANDEIMEGKEVKHALYDCGTNHRSFGDTGDFFAADLISGKMLVDNSPDCMKEGVSRDFTVDGECSMHKDPERCKLAIADIYNLKDHTWWQFDDSKEHLSCAYIPSKTSGYKGMLGISGVFDKDNSQIVVCIGTQEDELNQEFRTIINNNKITTVIVQIILVIVMFSSLFAVANLKSND